MNLRTMALIFTWTSPQAQVAWTDDRGRHLWPEWAKLVEPGYLTANPRRT